MDTDQLVTNTIIDYFGLSDIKNKFKGGMIAAKAATVIGRAEGEKDLKKEGEKDLEKEGEKEGLENKEGENKEEIKDLEKKVTQKKTKDKSKNVKGKLKDWATDPGPGKPIGDNSVFDNTESLLKKLVQIFSLVFYIITLPLMPWIWMFKKTRSSMDTTYKKSLRPL